MVRSFFFYNDTMTLAERLNSLLDSLKNEALASGRSENEVRLVAVSKTRSEAEVREALAAGQTCFGENRVSEALEKFASLVPQAELHLIGHLQGNKARTAAGRFALIHSVDSVKLARQLSGFCEQQGVVQPILLQVNTSGEDTKSGFLSLPELEDAAGEILSLPALDVRGLMTMAPLTDNDSIVAGCFAGCRRWREQLAVTYPGRIGPELSMGMSGDFPLAIREGATLVRIGTALFGERSIPA